MGTHDRSADQDRMDGIAEYRAGIFSWINNMVAAASTVAGNLGLHSGIIAFVTRTGASSSYAAPAIQD